MRYTARIRPKAGTNVPIVTLSHQRDLDQTDRLQTLNEIGRVVSSTLDLATLYETIYRQICRVMDAAQFFIALVRPNGRSLELVYYREEGHLYEPQEFEFGGNLTSLVIERGIPLLFQTDDDYSAFGRQNALPDLMVGTHDSEAKIWVPLNTGNRTIGALSVQSSRERAYSEHDLRTLSVIASQAAVAIENARLYERSQENVRRMHALLQVAQIINGSLDLETVLDSILVGMRDVMPYYFGAILLPDHERQVLDIVGSHPPVDEQLRETLKIPFGKGITGTVFASGKPLYVPNVVEWDNYVPHNMLKVHSEMAVPLKRGNSVVGVLDLERTEIDAFNRDDLDLLELFASQAAIAIENARLFAAQQQRVFELQVIETIVQQITPLHDVNPIAEVIAHELKALVDYHSCRVFALDTDDGQLKSIGDAGSDGPGLSLRPGEGIGGWVAEHGEAVAIPNSLLDERVLHLDGTPRRAESIMAVPISYQGHVRGVLTLSKLGVNQFDENSMRLLEIIAAQAGIAFDRAALYNKLRNEAVTDPLTALHNRRYLFERFRAERSRALRNHHPLTAIMIDIDRFKRVNDTYGHEAGDFVLVELARMIRGVVRTEDVVARYGGEEFCVLLPEIATSDAKIVADRLRSGAAQMRLPQEAGTKGITVSVGLALMSPEDLDYELFSRADLAMYQVKRRGGNKVCVSIGQETCFPFLAEEARPE